METDLTQALARLPRKGLASYPFKARSHTRAQRTKPRWYVHENVHGWAVENGFLTGAIFKRTKRTSIRFCLLLVGPCPWTPGKLRYYQVSLQKTANSTTPYRTTS